MNVEKLKQEVTRLPDRASRSEMDYAALLDFYREMWEDLAMRMEGLAEDARREEKQQE